MMRAALVTRIGEPPSVQEVARPTPEDNQTLVAVTAAPLNPIESRIAAGQFARRAHPPYVPGLEGVGRLVEANGLPPGTRVRFETALPGFGANGSLAELACAETDSVVALPDAVDDETAAALGVVGVTALLALERASVQPGETVLVLGATGAVGQAAVQIARVLGAGRVVAAGRDARALDFARASLGADAVVELAGDAPRDVLTPSLRTAAGGDIDVVIDPLWGTPALAALGTIAPGGRLVNVGEAAGADNAPPLAQLRNRQAAIHGLSTGWVPLGEKREAYRRLLELVCSGDLKVPHETRPLDDITNAWQRQSRSPGGKLVITP